MDRNNYNDAYNVHPTEYGDIQAHRSRTQALPAGE